jgi:predicted RNA-binding protein YlqC (UPF0109 family)
MSENLDKNFLESIIKSIVSVPDAVTVERTVDERGVLLTLKIDPSDMGFVIGRRGQTAQAIRTLLKVVGARNNSRVNLKIYDPNNGNRPERREYSQDNTIDASSIDTSAIDDLKI